MPLQRIETIDEPRDREKAKQGNLFDLAGFAKKAHRDDFRNLLIWGDNKLAMAALLEQFRGKIDLIYIDPPFDVGADFTMQVQLGEEGEAIQKEQSIMEAVAYRDTWGKGTDSYLHMMYERLALMNDLLSAKGSIYVHCDYRANSVLRQLLDEIFSVSNFVNEIIWQKTLSRKAQSTGFGNIHDTILLFSRSSNYNFNTQYDERDEEAKNIRFPEIEPETGRRFVWDNFTQAGQGPARRFGGKLLDPPPGKHWIWTQERIDAGWKEGIIQIRGNMPRLRRYETEGAFAGDLWIGKQWIIHSQSTESLGYTTQKPEALLERIKSGSAKVGGVWQDVKPAFAVSDLANLYTDLKEVNTFRNTRVAHVESKIDDPEEAWRAMRAWLRCLGKMAEIGS